VKKKLITHFYNLAKNKLFSLNRSLTGNDTLKSLQILRNEIPQIKIKKFKCGKKVYDWKVPSEWNVKDAFVKDYTGKKIIDFKLNNLHLVSYSKPINKFYSKKELFKKLYYSNKLKKAIPYVTSYYKKDWGFCVSKNQYDEFNKIYKKSDKFYVSIKSEFKKDGFMNYAELIIPGQSKQELLISSYICHPSMANNELSGPIVWMALAKYFLKKKNKKTLRFILIPETIGSIAYINKNFTKLKKNVLGGYILTTIGDERNHSCLLSKQQNSLSDQCLLKAYKNLKIKKFKKFNFADRGSDERQFNSPWIDLKLSSIFRSKYQTYKEYHTSFDNFELVTQKGVLGGFRVAQEALNIFLNTIVPICKVTCEPMLSKKRLYPSINSELQAKTNSKKLLEFLQYSDGNYSLEQIAQKIKFDKKKTYRLLNILKKNNLIVI
jgi:aminopeptidase-like protein